MANKKVDDELKVKPRCVSVADHLWTRIGVEAGIRKISNSELIRKAVIRFLKKGGK